MEPHRAAAGRDIVYRWARRSALAALAAAALLYAADYLWLRVRLPGSLGTVEVQPYYTVPQRSGKTEIIMLDPDTESCVKSLLPHMGHRPCWYVARHTQKPIAM